MPAYSKENQHYYESRIRSIMVLRPEVSLREIQQTLEDSTEAPLHLTLNYISKLKHKIVGERAHRNDNLNKGARIAALQDKHAMVAQRLWVEASNIKNPGVVRVMALKALVELDTKMLNAEMDAGIYERALGTLEVARKPISVEDANRIMASLKMWGILPEQAKQVLNITATEKPRQENATATNNTN